MKKTTKAPSGGDTAYISVKVAEDVYRLLRAVAGWRGQTIADFLTEIAREPARREFGKMLKEGGADGQ